MKNWYNFLHVRAFVSFVIYLIFLQLAESLSVKYFPGRQGCPVLQGQAEDLYWEDPAWEGQWSHRQRRNPPQQGIFARSKPVFRICDTLRQTRSVDWIPDPYPDPALFVHGFQDANEKRFLSFFCLLLL